MEKRKNGQNRIKRRLFGILTFLLAGLLCFSLFFLIRNLSRYRKGEELYDSIENRYVMDSETDFSETDSETDSGETDSGGSENESQAEKIIVPPLIDHAGLLSENGDYVGWLRIEGCGIDLPVVRGKDNDEYLHTGFDRTYIYQGTLFIDWQNSGDFSDPNTILYGHNMKNRSMFGNLKKYLDADFARSNNSFWLCTENYAYLYRIYSVAVVNADGGAYLLFSDYGEEYAEYITERISDSYTAFDETPDAEARTLTLSTCYGTGEDGRRLIVQAYRAGAYPAEGCTEEEATENEMAEREN